jgi:hypothetical protein
MRVRVWICVVCVVVCYVVCCNAQLGCPPIAWKDPKDVNDLRPNVCSYNLSDLFNYAFVPSEH